MKPINVGLLGIGTVGGGTWDVLNAQRRGDPAPRGTRHPHRGGGGQGAASERKEITGGKAVVTDDAFGVVRGKDVDIVIELIGGYTVAKQLVLEAIANGKHVVTANKALLATHGNEIFAAAQKKGVMVAFEASVGGGIPIIKALREGLAANRIEWIAGIINGTSNFILSEMRDKGAAVRGRAEGRAGRGYAEADPDLRHRGRRRRAQAHHPRRRIAFGIPMQFEKAYTEGISKLTAADIGYAEELGYRIKLLGITRRTRSKGIELRVHPTLVPARRLIANVEGVMNAILVKGDAVGATLYYGAGAGRRAHRERGGGRSRRRDAPASPPIPSSASRTSRSSPTGSPTEPVLPMGEVETSYYLRMRVLDRPGVLADITRILADSAISIDAMVQKEPGEGESRVDIVMLTHLALEKNVEQAMAKIERLSSVEGRVTRIRLESLL